jgi:GTPase SAR1 family protein
MASAHLQSPQRTLGAACLCLAQAQKTRRDSRSRLGWVLPSNPKTREKLQWLAAEIKEMEGGEATLWEAQQVFTGEDSNLIAQFNEQVNKLYQAILDELEREEADLSALSKQYQQAKLQDYFNSALGEKLREILLSRRGEAD